MVIRRKPKSVDDFIQEGGSVPPVAEPAPSQTTVEEPNEEEVKGLKLRLPTSLLRRVDDAVAARRPAPSRHQWILEAIYEKLDRETDESDR